MKKKKKTLTFARQVPEKIDNKAFDQYLSLDYI